MAKKSENDSAAKPEPKLKEGIAYYIAQAPLAEVIAGEMVRFAKGDKIPLDKERARALGELVKLA